MKGSHKQLTRKVKTSIAKNTAREKRRSLPRHSFAEAFRLLRETSEDENTTRLFKRLKVMIHGKQISRH